MTVSMNNAAEFETKKDDVFARIASRYDVLCDLFSLGIHRLWKRRVSEVVTSEPSTKILDVASGTGDIVLRILSKSLSPNVELIASDISPSMLNIAQNKLLKYEPQLKFQILDAHSMPEVKSDSVDAVSMSLVLKICDRDSAMREAFRVLKPGGRLITLEASNIPVKWLHKAYLFYMSLCMPLLGWLATKGDSSAYKYLLNGVNDFPSAESLKSEMHDLGFTQVSFERLTFGIVAIHTAKKPN